MKALDLLYQYQQADEIAGGYMSEPIDKAIKELENLTNTQESAETKQFELCRKWVHEDKFNQYLKDNKITEINLETFANYYLEVEDDSYVGINKVILEA